MRYLSVRLLKSFLKAFAYSVVGALIVLIAGLIGYLESRPDLSVWHETVLDGEFTEHSPVADFAGYLALEARLFKQLDERIYGAIKSQEKSPINRYHRGSLADPERWTPNWNRSFELEVDSPRAGVLIYWIIRS